VLEFHQLSRRLRARREPNGGYKQALAHVDFRAVPGKITGLLGPNGAGKTTAMKLVFGLLAVQAGAVTWAGEPIGLLQRRRFCYMPESRSPYPGMRVADQLVYFARHHGLGRAEATVAVDAWLDRLGLTGFARRRLGSLSLGEQQRVQLVSAFSHLPTLAVLDEPLSGLDLLAVDTVGETLRAAAAARGGARLYLRGLGRP
jgi:ABC-2 type transport system ATP-binding protein